MTYEDTASYESLGPRHSAKDLCQLSVSIAPVNVPYKEWTELLNVIQKYTITKKPLIIGLFCNKNRALLQKIACKDMVSYESLSPRVFATLYSQKISICTIYELPELLHTL